MHFYNLWLSALIVAFSKQSLFCQSNSFHLRNLSRRDNKVIIINAAHNVIERNHRLERTATVWFWFEFGVKNRIHCRFFKTVRRVVDINVVEKRFKHEKNLFSFNKGWALIFNGRQLLVRSFTSGWLGWYLEEKTSCYCWERFPKNVISDQISMPLHDCLRVKATLYAVSFVFWSLKSWIFW